MKSSGILYHYILLSLLAACSSGPTRSSSQVELFASLAQAAPCTLVKQITETERNGRDMLGNAMKNALQDAADAGADAFYVTASSTDVWPDGATVTGNAYLCKKNGSAK